MNKPKQQGTAWETAFVNGAHAAGLFADRMPEGGMNDAGDVWIGDTPKRDPMGMDIAVLAWSRLVDNGSSKRVADGERSVVVVSTNDFYRLAQVALDYGWAFVVECKATERLNVTRTLANAKRKLARWKER